MKQLVKFPKWVKLEDLTKLFNILAQEGECRLVGGCVRDILSESVSQDIDIATEVLPENVMKLLTKNKVKCIPTGIKHGTVTAVLNGTHYEITTLRTDENCDGRHAKVSYTSDWKADAARRDFTVNAMYLDLAGNVYDYFGGQEDLAKRLIRFVGDPKERIVEDYLRILRFFRFYGYLGGSSIDEKSLAACSSLASNISKLSGERIKTELLKILSGTFVKETVQLLFKHKILAAIGLNPKPQNYEHYKFTIDPYLNFASLILACNLSKLEFKQIALRIKLSNKERDLISTLCFDMEDATEQLLKNLYYHGAEITHKKLVLYNIISPNKDLKKAYELVASYKHKKLPIDGNDLLELGFSGKLIAKGIEYGEQKWIESDFSLNKEQLLYEIKEYQRTGFKV